MMFEAVLKFPTFIILLPNPRFIHNVKLSSLSLAFNQIVFISDGMLESFERLKYLDLINNPITCDKNVVGFYDMAVKR